MNANKDRMATIIIEQTATQWGIPLPEKSLNRRSTRKRTTAEKPRPGQSDACVAFADGAHSGGCPPEVFTLRGAARLCVLVARIGRCGPASGIPGSPRSGRAKRGQPASRPRGYGPVAIGGD